MCVFACGVCVCASRPLVIEISHDLVGNHPPIKITANRIHEPQPHLPGEPHKSAIGFNLRHAAGSAAREP